MAKLNTPFSFTGKIGDMTAYKMRGVEGIILRGHGGATAEQIKTGKNFVNTRRTNNEFGGRSAASKIVMAMIQPMKALADYNISGFINGLLKPIQELDKTSDWGKRNIILSADPTLLAGFSLNMKNPFDSIIRNTLQYDLDKNDLLAGLSIPALLPGINFFVPWNYPFFSIQATLGIIPDLYYEKKKDVVKYKPKIRESIGVFELAETDWFPVSSGSPATALQLEYKVKPSIPSYSMVLAVGIRYGNMGAGNIIRQIPFAGAAKILALA